MNVFIILQPSRNVRLRLKWFSGENKEIQLSVNYYVFVLIFHKNAQIIAVFYICVTWRNVMKPS